MTDHIFMERDVIVMEGYDIKPVRADILQSTIDINPVGSFIGQDDQGIKTEESDIV